MNVILFLTGLIASFFCTKKYNPLQLLIVGIVFFILAFGISSIWGCNFGITSFAENSECLSTGFSALTNEYKRNQMGTITPAGLHAYWISLGCTVGCFLCAIYVKLLKN